jgi:hypothetical protein
MIYGEETGSPYQDSSSFGPIAQFHRIKTWIWLAGILFTPCTVLQAVWILAANVA